MTGLRNQPGFLELLKKLDIETINKRDKLIASATLEG
jgi:hypothetical protein